MISILAWSLATPGHAQPSMEGRYRMTLHSATRAKVPVFGWTPSATITTLVVDIESRGQGYQQRHQVCDVEVRSKSKKTRTIIPPAFVAALPEKRYALQVAGATDQVRYRADLGLDHLGYDPAKTDTVPTEPDDPALVDADGDGHPGATVLLDVPMFGSAELYVVQRARMVLDGVVGADGAVQGTLRTHQFEQHTVDASNRMFRTSPQIRAIEEESWFRLEPAPTASCEAWTVEAALAVSFPSPAR